jgi:aurora kinase
MNTSTSKIPCTFLPSSPLKLTHFIIQEWKQRKIIYDEHFTRVILLEHIQTKHLCALKLYLKKRMTERELHRKQKDFVREIRIHYLMDGIPNILPLYFWFETKTVWGLMTKYMNHSYLLHRIYNFSNEKRIIHEIIYPLLNAIYSLHSQHIIHRDIKPENIFIHHSNLFLGDFGYSYILSKEESCCTSLAGTITYMAPELLYHYIDSSHPLKYSYEIDIWSLGIIVYEMLFHIKPFGWSTYKNFSKEDPSKPAFILKRLNTPLLLSESISISEEATDFLQKCLDKKPTNRPTIVELLEHPWILNYLKGMVEDSSLRKCPSVDLIVNQKSHLHPHLHQVNLLQKKQLKESFWKNLCIMC